MLPAGKYVVEMVVPPGYELVKEEDKNILIGDNYIAPVTPAVRRPRQHLHSSRPGRSRLPATTPTTPRIRPPTWAGPTLPSTEADTGSVENFWPCVGEPRIVPDYISLFPQSGEVAPFAGATRPLCDRKEVTLADQTSALAKFYVFTSTHAAAHFTGVITDDFTSEFDPFSPQFGEKFAPPDLPISIKDWTGTEIARIYADHWGAYNGLTYSTWEVNPPNPTGYAPTMMVTCMNDPGTGRDTRSAVQPAVQPVLLRDSVHAGADPVHGYAGHSDVRLCGRRIQQPGLRLPRCHAGDQRSGWRRSRTLGERSRWTGHTLTITALGDQLVPNNAYSGPSATTAPFNRRRSPATMALAHRGNGSPGRQRWRVHVLSQA